MNDPKVFDVIALLDYLKPRSKYCHKGDFGRVLIIGGNLGYSGAVRLAGEAALRVGAGCVSIATHPQHAHTLNGSRPELICHGVSASSDLDPLLEWATFIVIGPGLGTDEWGRSLLTTTLKQFATPTLFDADALNILALTQIAVQRDNCIFTPHPGEAARLLHIKSQTIQQNRIKAIHALQKQLGGIIILKGAQTLVLSPKMDAPELCRAGNPGMATAGMGDVLSGIISGLAVQNISLAIAAKLGVLIHAMAGDVSASESGERGMIASDVIGQLRKIVNGTHSLTLTLSHPS